MRSRPLQDDAHLLREEDVRGKLPCAALSGFSPGVYPRGHSAQYRVYRAPPSPPWASNTSGRKVTPCSAQARSVSR